MMHKGKKGPYSMLRRFDRMALGLFLLIAFGLFLGVNLEMRRLAQVEARARAELILSQTEASYQVLAKLARSPQGGEGQSMAKLLEETQPRIANEGIVRIAVAGSGNTDSRPDPVEQRFLDQLPRDETQQTAAALRRIDGQHFYVVMQRGPTIDGQASLLALHVPLEKIHHQANQNSLRMMLLILSALGMLYMLQRVMIGKYIAAPLHYLRTLAYRLSNADEPPATPLARPREIELGETIDAFNKLAREREKFED